MNIKYICCNFTYTLVADLKTIVGAISDEPDEPDEADEADEPEEHDE